MASAAPSPLASSTETTNGTKLRRLLVDGGTTVLRKVFDGIYPPAKLSASLHSYYSTLDELFVKGILSKQQRELLFPPDGSKPDSKTFDITLLFLLLTEICGFSPPHTGWNNKPHAKNKTLAANLVRIKLFRNKLIHTPETRIDTRLFNELWKEISGVLVALGLGQADIDKLKAERCGEEDYVGLLFQWADREKDIKSMVKEVQQGQDKTKQAVDKVCQTQQDHKLLLQDVNKAVETVGESQQKQILLLQDTSKAAETVFQTQQEIFKALQDTQEAVKDVQEFSQNTQQVVKQVLKTHQEVLQTQQEVRHTQQEDHRTLQVTHQAVENVQQIQKGTDHVVNDILKTQQKVRQTQQEDQRTFQDTQRAVEDVLQVQHDTHQVVEKVLKTQEEAYGAIQEVHQTQREDRSSLQGARKEIEGVLQINKDTHQLLLGVLKTQQETRHTQQEVRQWQREVHEAIQEVVKTQKDDFKTLQKVKETVENLSERSDKDKEDEILSKLAKINTQKVIKYHAERYQEGTRVSFFERVEKWLDDGSSSNRVMVISGNAGMGKSVISAIVCKRMQEAGRLSGSHFCQHDKARYRNGKIMLQSLACQLSDSLPEYKNALVKTLSRNLGIELNKMEVKDLFEVLFEEPLSELKDPGRNILMVIDGLDESEYQGRNELLDVIANHFTKLPCWIRFLVTTRPDLNIADSLKGLKPLQLESNDEENLMDVRLLFEKRLNDVIQQDHKEVIISDLVKKSEGLILYAFLLVNFIKENVSLLDPERLDSTLPSGISSIYQTYFQRLETELCKELKIKEERFLSFLSAVTAAREPLPLDFVTKIILSGANSLADRRKMKKVIACISALLPVRDDCIHFFHKSVKDWLTDKALYGQHDYTADEKDGHRILSELCTNELDDIKRESVGSVQFSGTANYALRHGVSHMLYLANLNARAFEEITRKYVVDLELVYAKLCVRNATAAEDILCIQQQILAQELSDDSKEILNTLVFLLRNYIYNSTFTSHPQGFFQTMLNEGGPVLSSVTTDLLKEKYPEIPYMKFPHSERKEKAVLARFECSSKVACFDVSPQLDNMVCECMDETIQLWSLNTGKLVWTRPVIVKKPYFGMTVACRRLPNLGRDVFSYYRSVVFNPAADSVLPGVLSHTYTFDGELKPLFLESKCRFTVCSVSRDKTKMLTDCPDDAKCIIMWSLENGSEITRTTRNKDVLSFAWSPDGKLLAISHSHSISIADTMDGFRTLAETNVPDEYGTIMFSPDCRSLYCMRPETGSISRLDLSMAELPSCTYITTYYEPDVPSEFESPCEAGFLLGDPLSSYVTALEFVLNKQSVLRASPHLSYIHMLNTNELRITERETTLITISNIVFSLSGETIYVVSDSLGGQAISAWDVSSGELIAQKSRQTVLYSILLAVKEGVLLTTASGIPELWNFDLSQCVRTWTDINGVLNIIPISEERVVCETTEKAIILDTTSGEIVSTFLIRDYGSLSGCNSQCQLLIESHPSVYLWDGKSALWEKNYPCKCPVFSILEGFERTVGVFSLSEQFVVILRAPILREHSMRDRVYVLDAVSGKTLHILQKGEIYDFEFVSDEECVISSDATTGGSCLQLFNVRSGDLLSVINLDTIAKYLAACSRKRLLAISQVDSKHGFKLVQVHLPQDNDSRRSKW